MLTHDRLRVEKEALDALLRPPAIPEPPETYRSLSHDNMELLSERDAALWTSLNQSKTLSDDIANRMSSINTTIGPAIDTFADGVHKLAQYRNAAENVSACVLSICAEKLSEREKEGRRKALGAEEHRSPGRDLNNVLRGLSRTDR